MTEERLEQYRAIKQEMAQLEERIRRLKDSGPQMIADTVTTAASFPFSKHRTVIRGVAADEYQQRLRRLQDKYTALLTRAQKELEELEDYIVKVPDAQIRTIMRYRYVEGWSWQRIAFKMGWYCESAPRQKIKKFLRQTEKTDFRTL